MIVFANRNQIHPRRAAALLLFCGFAAVTWAQDEALVRAPFLRLPMSLSPERALKRMGDRPC